MWKKTNKFEPNWKNGGRHSKGNPKQPVAHCIGPEGEWGFIALDVGDCIAEVNCNFKEISLTISKVKEINKKTGKATLIKNYYVSNTIILDEEYLIHEFTTVYKAVLNAYHKAIDFEWNRKMYFKENDLRQLRKRPESSVLFGRILILCHRYLRTIVLFSIAV